MVKHITSIPVINNSHEEFIQQVEAIIQVEEKIRLKHI